MEVLKQTVQMVIFLIFLLVAGSAFALTDIMKGAMVKADPPTVSALRASFDLVEEALRAENINGVVAIYAKDYRHQGLGKKATIRIWKNIFEKYDRLSSRHLFTKIVVDDETGVARLTCTGALMGALARENKDESKPEDLKSKPVRIDAWFEATHYMILENGAWRFTGHDPDGGKEAYLGEGIHLLF